MEKVLLFQVHQLLLFIHRSRILNCGCGRSYDCVADYGQMWVKMVTIAVATLLWGLHKPYVVAAFAATDSNLEPWIEVEIYRTHYTYLVTLCWRNMEMELCIAWRGSMSGCCAFFDSLILVTEIYFFSSNISFLLNLAKILKREFLPYRSSISIIFSFQHLGEVPTLV